MDITELYKHQIDLSAWFEAVGYKDIEKLRKEDNDKRERLAVLNQIIGLPFDRQTRFDAVDIEAQTPEFLSFLQDNGEKLCALRLVPKDPSLPKLRMRGKTIRDVLDWYQDQDIDPKKYWADFVPHSDTTTWSTIFVVHDEGIVGEVIRGGHHQLTQGFYEGEPPHQFYYDFKTLKIERDSPDIRSHLTHIFSWLSIESDEKRKMLTDCLQTQFAGEYIKGYFETVYSDVYGLWFIDYNRILGDLWKQPSVSPSSLSSVESSTKTEPILQGTTASPGQVTGVVRILDSETVSVGANEIIVCEMTTPSHLPFMKQAAGIITDRGGILSHAAVVSRELGKPCLVGTERATSLLHNNEKILLDAFTGHIFRL